MDPLPVPDDSWNMSSDERPNYYTRRLRERTFRLHSRILEILAAPELPETSRSYLTLIDDGIDQLVQAATNVNTDHASSALKQRIDRNLRFLEMLFGLSIRDVITTEEIPNPEDATARLDSLLSLHQNAKRLANGADLGGEIGSVDWAARRLVDYRQALVNVLDTARLLDVENLKARYAADNFVNDAVKALNQRLEEHFGSAAKMIDSKVGEFESRAEALKRSLVSTHDDEIEDLRRKVSAALGSSIDNITRAGQEVDKDVKALQATVAQWLDQGERSIDEIEQMRTDMAKLTSLLAGETIAEAYSASSKTEGVSAQRWRLFSIVLGFGGIAVLIAAFIVGRDATSVAQIAPHLAASVALGSLSAYAGRQAAGHRREQLATRAKALRLLAFRISLSDQTEAVQAELRQKLSMYLLEKETHQEPDRRWNRYREYEFFIRRHR